MVGVAVPTPLDPPPEPVRVGVIVGVGAFELGRPPTTLVASLALSFDRLRSPAVATTALLMTASCAWFETRTVNVRNVTAFGCNMIELTQVVTCPAALQRNPPPVLLTKANPTGNVSVTMIDPFVGPSPTLVTEIV